MTKILFYAMILLNCCGCQAAFQDWQEERLLSHLSKIKNYRGTIVESGILDSKEDLVSEIWFEKPGHYLTVVQAPEKQAGTKLAFDGKTLQVFYPKSKFGIVFKNLKPLSENESKKLIEDQFQSNVNTFDYEIGPTVSELSVPPFEHKIFL